MASSPPDIHLQTYSTGQSTHGPCTLVNEDGGSHLDIGDGEKHIGTSTERLLHVEEDSESDIKEPAGQTGEAPLEPPNVGSDRGSIIWDWWLWEIAGLALSLGFTVVIIVILAIYDDKPLPTWPYNITLNAMVSVLSTMAKVRPQTDSLPYNALTHDNRVLCYLQLYNV